MNNTLYTNAYYAALRNRFKTLFNRYKVNTLADGGTVRNDSITKAYMKMAQDNRMSDSIKFAWLGDAGTKVVNGRVSKAYGLPTKLLGGDNATQATAGSQPYLGGNIAPNERYALKNPNGGYNYMTHPTISFGATDSWSVTTVLNWNGLKGIGGGFWQLYCGNNNIASNLTFIGFNRNTHCIDIYTKEEGSYSFGNFTEKFAGKNIIVTIVAGSNYISVYVNGLLFQTMSITNKSMDFSTVGSAYNSAFNGKIGGHIVRAYQALTATEVLAEYNFLKPYFPEMESVVIGTQTWTTSNCAVAASSNGTVIPDGTLTANWTAGTSYWCHHTDINTGAIYDKLYNKAGRDIIVANPPDGWHVATEAELTAIVALGGTALKLAGNTYWTTANGSNSTGLSLLGSSKRNADGSFGTIKSECYIWCANSDKVLKLTDAGVSTIEAVTSVNDGYAIRFVKN
jgi:uncharacterized protein (TIGR02145 family)